MNKNEPPDDATHCLSVIYIGRDHCGRWVAQDAAHLCGGLFVSRAAAMKFALDETDHHPELIVDLIHPVELDYSALTALPVEDHVAAKHAA